MSIQSRLNHQPLKIFKPQSLVWTTQFNDLRLPASLGSNNDEVYRQILLELKTLTLLLPRVLIRDSDLVNHLILQELIRSDIHGICQAIQDRIIVFGIRTTAENFSDMNEQSGKERAFPDRYEDAKESLKEIDLIFRNRDISVADIVVSDAADRFEENLLKILSGNVLLNKNSKVLKEAIDKTKDKFPERKKLYFGDMYQFMVKDRRQDPYGEVVQWCRAAHSLVHPTSVSFAPSASNRDLRHDMVAFLLNQSGGTIQEPSRLFDLYPKRILNEVVLDNMSFQQIALLRRKGFEIGYFKAAENLQAKINSPNFEKEYMSYLQIIGEYLNLFGTELSIELTDWQKGILKEGVKLEEIEKRILAFGIPITISSLFFLTTWSPVPLAIAPFVIGGANLFTSLQKARNPSPLSKLLRGLSVTPPTK